MKAASLRETYRPLSTVEIDLERQAAFAEGLKIPL